MSDLTCDVCGREIKPFSKGDKTVDFIRRAVINGKRVMACPECLIKAGQSAETPGQALHRLNDERKRKHNRKH